MNASLLTSTGECPATPNGACVYGAWVPTGSMSFHDAKHFGKMLLKPRFGGFRCPHDAYFSGKGDSPQNLSDCACYHGYQKKSGECAEMPTQKVAVEEEKNKNKNKKQTMPQMYTCPDDSYVGRKARYPLKSFVDCTCAWGYEKGEEDAGAAGKCIESPQTSTYECPQKSFVKLGAGYPLKDFRDCTCFVGYRKEKEKDTEVVLAGTNDDDTAGADADTGDGDYEPESESVRKGKCTAIPPPPAPTSITASSSSTAIAVVCPKSSYLSATHWPIRNIADDCTCIWGFAMDKENQQCITAAEMEKKRKLQAARKGRSCYSYEITIRFKRGVTCEQAKSYMAIIIRALQKKLGVTDVFVMSSTCTVGGGSIGSSTGSRSRRHLTEGGGVDTTIGALNEIATGAGAEVDPLLKDTVMEAVVQSTLADTGVELASSPVVSSSDTNTDTNTDTDTDTNTEDATKTASSKEAGGSSTLHEIIPVVCYVGAALIAMAVAFVVIRSRRDRKGNTEREKMQELTDVVQTGDTVDTL